MEREIAPHFRDQLRSGSCGCSEGRFWRTASIVGSVTTRISPAIGEEGPAGSGVGVTSKVLYE
jgi:hypothetical protein